MHQSNMSIFRCLLTAGLFAMFGFLNQSFSQEPNKAEEIFAKAVAAVGGESYVKAKSQISRGRYSVIREGSVISSQTFVDVIVFPMSERTDFKNGSSKISQANSEKGHWTFETDNGVIKDQTDDQKAQFVRGMRVSIDHLLRGFWRGNGKLSYVGKRAATLGKRNEVIKLTYDDGFAVEFEFSQDNWFAAKAIYKTPNAEGVEQVNEDRFAQFIQVNGIYAPFIIDRFVENQHATRINFESIDFNKTINPKIFERPSNPKDAQKELKF